MHVVISRDSIAATFTARRATVTAETAVIAALSFVSRQA
jgi:hypothetical protein